MSKSDLEKRIASKLVEAGRRPEWTGRVVNPPVYRASNAPLSRRSFAQGKRFEE